MKDFVREVDYNKKEVILIVLFYGFVALSSIINLGFLAAPGFLALLLSCALLSPRCGFLALVAMFYLPMGGVKLPMVFIIATAIVGFFNILKVKTKDWYIVNKNIIILYLWFLLFRFISILFVENKDAFSSYFFVSFSVFVHILVISFLIKDRDDILFILRMWGVIGAFSAVLGYLHFSMQDSVYLRQIFIQSGDYDKSTIEGTFDFVRWIWAGAEPNFQGLILLIPFSINLYFLTKKNSVLNIVLTVVSFIGVLGTFSRTSFIVSVLIVILFTIIPQEKGKLLNVKRILLIFTLFLFVVFIITLYFPDFVERFFTIQEAATTYEASGRLPLYKEAIHNFINNPFLGIGTGQTAYLSKHQLESHNLFLQTLGENGVISFIILLAMFWGYLRKAYNIRYQTRLYLIAGLAIILNANTVSYFDMRLFFSLYVLLNYDFFNKDRVKATA